MTQIKNERFQIPQPGGADPLIFTTAQLLRDFAQVDQRFGVSLERLKLAAQVFAACDSGNASGTLEFTAEQAQLLAESIRNPQGWFFPAPVRGIADRIEQICNDLEGKSSTNETT